MNAPIQKVIVAGRDAPLWLAVNALHHALGPAGVTVEAVELPPLMKPADIYPTLPALEAFHGRLGIDEHDLLKATRGSFTLGQSLHGFAPAPYFHPYGSHGIDINRVPFMQFLTRARGRGLNVAFEDFSLTAAAAKQNRFVVPDDETTAFGRTDYGYHLPARAYGAFLKDMAVKAGVAVHTARTVSAVVTEAGDIAALETGGERIEGDLFIDVTGTDSLLLRQALKAPFESWRPWFSGTRVLSAAGDRLPSLPPYSRLQALDTGWIGLYAAQDATRVTYVFDGRTESDDKALQTATTTSGLRLRDAVASPLEPGRSTAWVRNCIAIGEAACVFDPIASPGLHAVQLGLVHLLSLFPLDRRRMPERAEYNRLMQMAFERLRDFQIVHGLLCHIHSPFWDRARSAPTPETVRARLDTFAATGLVPLFDEDSYPTDSWNAVFLGQEQRPDHYDPAADLTDDAALMANLKGMLGFIRQQVEQAHGHDAYLEIFCSD